MGLGVVYVGGMRKKLREVADLLSLPAVFDIMSTTSIKIAALHHGFLTTDPNGLVKSMHEKMMPVLLLN